MFGDIVAKIVTLLEYFKAWIGKNVSIITTHSGKHIVRMSSIRGITTIQCVLVVSRQQSEGGEKVRRG